MNVNQLLSDLIALNKSMEGMQKALAVITNGLSNEGLTVSVVQGKAATLGRGKKTMQDYILESLSADKAMSIEDLCREIFKRGYSGSSPSSVYSSCSTRMSQMLREKLVERVGSGFYKLAPVAKGAKDSDRGQDGYVNTRFGRAREGSIVHAMSLVPSEPDARSVDEITQEVRKIYKNGRLTNQSVNAILSRLAVGGVINRPAKGMYIL